MAGNYPDAPSRRLAWDADGTQCFYVVNDTYVPPTPPANPDLALGVMSALDRQKLNNENNDSLSFTTGITQRGGMYFYLVFPDGRDIDGYYWNILKPGWSSWLRTSTDTTTGFDGTYAALGSQIYQTVDVVPDFRDSIETSTPTGITGIFFGMAQTTTSIDTQTFAIKALHLYGVPSAGANADRLIFLDTADSDAEYTLPIDDGDVGRGANTAFNLKVKNNSSTKQANTVAITADAISEASDGWFTFATTVDGTYSATLALGDLTSGSSVTVYAKKDIPDAENLGIHVARLTASKGSWT